MGIRVPPYMINWLGIFSLNLFWDYDKTLPLMGVRDIYQLEFDLFQSAGWVAFYMASVVVFMVHASLGWNKCVATPKFGFPQGHQRLVRWFGWIIFGFSGQSICHTLHIAYSLTQWPQGLNVEHKLIMAHPENPPPEYLQCPPQKHIHSK